MTESVDLYEEIFCLKYEINALAEVTLKNKSERWIPGFIHEVTEHDHIERYKLASDFSEGKKVLDIACGVGRGSYMLKTLGKAKSVLACDLDDDAVRYAKYRHFAVDISFRVENAELFQSNECFDLITSFETIEHLHDYEAFLKCSNNNLNKDGILMVSTPISKIPFDASPKNPYHVQEWGFLEFQNLISRFFKVEEIYTQLYQNEFYNEKLRKQYAIDLEIKDKSIAGRILKKYLKKTTPKISLPEYRTEWNSKKNQSILEKYSGQFSADKLGDYYSGYQLVICSKKGE